MNELTIESLKSQDISDGLGFVHSHVNAVIDKLSTTINLVVRNKEVLGNDILPHLKNSKFYRNQVPAIMNEISSHDGYEGGIAAINNLINLIINDSNNGGDFLRASNIVTRRIKQLLAEIFRCIEDGKQLMISEKYSTDVVGGGLLIKQISIQNQTTEVVSMDEFNENIYGLKFFVLNGGDIIHDPCLEKIKNDENFLYPDLFGDKESEKLSSMITESYIRRKSDISKVVLKATFSNFMLSQGKFLFMKDRSNELMSTLFVEECDDGVPHIWTIYIDEKYQSGFGLAALMQAYGLNMVDGKKAKLLSVLGSLPMEIYINNMGYVGVSIGGEVQGIPTTEQMLELVLDPNMQNITKDISLEQLMQYCLPSGEVEQVSQGNDEVKFVTLEKNDLSIIDKYLKKGYCIRKIFSSKTKYYIALEPIIN
ncbi:hypothetical protein A9Q91_05815 [Candidatus Gracilibacteria bacterium 28_42_T64]|nr:hypothetical protein A9Q91_05815 [Candidatus Gracilibacteria bacterium 28_42_T64]